MGPATLGQPLGTALKHDSHRRGDRPQCLQFTPTQRAGIDVGKSPVSSSTLRDRGHVVHGTVETRRLQPFPRCAIPQLGLFAERQQHLSAPGTRTLADGGDNLVYLKIQDT